MDKDGGVLSCSTGLSRTSTPGEGLVDGQRRTAIAVGQANSGEPFLIECDQNMSQESVCAGVSLCTSSYRKGGLPRAEQRTLRR